MKKVIKELIVAKARELMKTKHNITIRDVSFIC